jgi:putative membrane protein
MTPTNRWVAILAIGLTAAACARTDDADDAVVADTTNLVDPVRAGPSDAEIAHVAVTANTIDVDAGRLAKEKSKTKAVTDFADRMIQDHTGVNEQATALAGKLSLTPVDNATSQSLKTSADQTLEILRGKSGAEFDRAYLENEVAFHQTVLDAIDNTLIPNAQNAELKALLEQVRPAIAGHLEMARQFLAALPAQ